jgi:DinB superfamily
MFDRELVLNAWVVDFARKLAVGIDEDKMTVQPAPGMNTPQWVFGHLAVCTDYGLKLLGQPTSCPKVWFESFGIGSNPAVPPSPQPTKAELLEAIASGHSRLNAAMAKASEGQLAVANPFDFLAKALPTIGDLLAQLTTAHPAMHLGQLSAWRRLNGLPGVLGF